MGNSPSVDNPFAGTICKLCMFVCVLSLLCIANICLGDIPQNLKGVRKILFLGDSITYAGGYVVELQAAIWTKPWGKEIEVTNLGLPSETVSGLSEDGHAGGAFPRPDLHERLDRVLQAVKPDLVFASYGMNDGIYLPLNKDRFAKFRKGYETLHSSVIRSGAKFIAITPANYDFLAIHGHEPAASEFDYDSVLTSYSSWLVSQRKHGWNVIDVHSFLAGYRKQRRRYEPKFTFAADGVHPNGFGHYLISRCILEYLELSRLPSSSDNLRKSITAAMEARRDSLLASIGHKRPGMPTNVKIETSDELSLMARKLCAEKFATSEFWEYPGKISDYHGFVRHDFSVMGNDVILVDPIVAAKGNPWVWRAEFFDHRPEADIALLKKGWSLVYIQVGNTFGCPDAMEKWDSLYTYMTSVRKLSKHPALEGLSRGGLYIYNWSAQHPERVCALYGDAPVCDFKSWPGGKGKGPGSKSDWAKLIQDYHFTSEADAIAYPYNPVDNLKEIVKAKIPIIHVVGGADEVVPVDDNTYLLKSRLEQLGSRMELIVKPGGLHHPHGLDDPTPVVDFILNAFQKR